MDKIKSWLFKGNDHNSQMKGNESAEIEESKKGDPQTLESNDQTTPLQVKNEPDPDVVKFFKDFPEPYRTHAVARFSSREGLYKWDFFRDLAMKREFYSGMKGVFLEDKREFTRKLQEEEKKFIEEEMDKRRKENENRELPNWQKAIQSKIHVNEEETLGLKLLQTANLSLFGVVLLWTGLTLKKRRPHLPTWHYYSTIVGTSFFCTYLQVAAIYRLMDWGPFDRSVDNRSAMEKTREEIREFFSSLANNVFRKNDS